MRKHLMAGALAAAVAGSGALALFTGVAQAAPAASHQARAPWLAATAGAACLAGNSAMTSRRARGLVPMPTWRPRPRS